MAMGGIRERSLVRRLVLLTVFALGTACAPALQRSGTEPAGAVAASGASLPDDALLPVDPACTVGRLDNGLTYYIRPNAKPERRAELWLAVNAGSTLEDDDQQGLAHFVEHMAFNGTRNFEKNEIIGYLERIGMRFGPDVNAFTSFDETVYTLTVPTDDATIVATAFEILEDWAHGVTLEGEEIDKERGVVIEEWRQGRGAEARMRDRQLPVLFTGSRYAERLPIGKKEILEQAPHDTVRRFYREWYRPDLMAVIAVGDFDPRAIEKAIRKHFGRLRGPAQPRAREVFPVPDHTETLVAIASDPEATSTRVAVYTKLPKSEQGTVADYRRALVERLYHEMLNARLDELRREADPPFLFAFSGKGGFVRTRDVLVQSAGVKEGGLAPGLRALLVEVARVDRHGFTGTELDRVKKETLRRYEQAFRERDKEESDDHAGEALGHFLEGEPLPGVELELDLVRRFLPTVTLDEVNHLARQWISEQNRVILVNAPEKPGVAAPAEADVRAVFRAAEAESVEPYVDRVRDEPLVAKVPSAGRIVEEQTIAELGVTHWKLSNGAQVVLKPTDFKNDEVLLVGFSPGGHSLVPDGQHVSASHASAVVQEAGLGEFSRIELQKALAGKVVSAGAWIGELEEGVRASASPEDLETMFQLVHLKFTAPRSDEEAFRSWLSRTKGSIENRLARPETVFGDRMQVVMTQGHFRRRPPSVSMLDEIDPQVAAAVYRERYADAGDFTFVLVGNFEPDAIRPLASTWLGGLPASGRTETWRDVGVRPPAGIVPVEVRKGIEPKSQVRITFIGDAPWSRQDEHDVSSLAAALRIRLREVLREDMGGVYGVGVFGSISRRPVEQYSFTVAFGCAPDKVEELKQAAFDVIEAFRQGEFAGEIADKVKEQQTRQHETELRENEFWLGALAEHYRFGTDPKLILAYDELVHSVSAERLRAAARRYLDAQRYVIGVLYPEGPPAETSGASTRPGAAVEVGETHGPAPAAPRPR
jgi:zinc protease